MRRKQNPSAPAQSLDAQVRTKTDESGILDLPFLVLTLLLTLIGLVMLFSASYARALKDMKDPTFYFVRQAGFAAFGIFMMLLISRFTHFLWYRLALPILGAAIVMLLAVLVVGTSSGGATRWLFGFQPSEIAKLAAILFCAALMSKVSDKMGTLKYGVLPYAAMLGIIALLLYFEPHLSAIIIILLVTAAMMFMGGTKLRWFGLGVLLVGIFLVIYVTTKGYAGGRISAWLDPESDPSDSGYQIIQARYAIGSGGLLGQGFGRSRQKYLYLPEEHNDYIFAIVCEELGYLGALGIILLFALLIIRGYWIAMHARDRFGMLTAGGLTTLLAVQVLLNLGVVTSLLPATGISLPFFSYGGTALVLQLCEMGIILSISRWSNKEIVWGKDKV